MTEQQALYKYCLRLGDNALVLSYRLSEWCSKAPMLEEDLALTNMALDMLGRAQAMLTYAATVEGAGRSADDLAYRRGEREFYNNLITELPNGDFAVTMARMLFIAAFEYQFYTRLCNSSDKTLAAIAAKTLKEVKYHLAHATDWIVRMGNGTGESYRRTQKAVNDLWMYTGELFEMDEVDNMLIAANVVPDLGTLRAAWYSQVTHVLAEANVAVPEDAWMQTGSRKGVHTEYLGHILTEMQYLQRAYPDAVW